LLFRPAKALRDRADLHTINFTSGLPSSLSDRMFPTLRNRIIIVLAAALGGWIWTAALPWLTASDGCVAASLITAHGGTVKAVLMVVLTGLPALALAAVAGATGNPLSGVFTLAVSLCILAAHGEDMDAWVHRSGAALPGEFGGLILEAILWLCLLAASAAWIVQARAPLRRVLPVLGGQEHVGGDGTMSVRDGAAWAAAGVATLAGCVLGAVLLRTGAKGQVIGGLIAAFGLASFTADSVVHFLIPRQPRSVLRVLIPPALAAIIGYTLALIQNGDEGQFLFAFFANRTSRLAGALPIFYLSAGVAGCCLGAGASQVMFPARQTKDAVAAGQSGQPDAAAAA
jgi:hypothetical protein